MKKVMLVVLVAALVFAMATWSAFAGGDKERGDKGQGEVTQVQVQDPPPFQP